MLRRRLRPGGAGGATSRGLHRGHPAAADAVRRGSGAYFLFHGSHDGGLKDILINCGYPLIERFPLMFFTSAVVLLIGMVRWYTGMSCPTGPHRVRRRRPSTSGGGLVSAVASKMSALIEASRPRRGPRPTSRQRPPDSADRHRPLDQGRREPQRAARRRPGAHRRGHGTRARPRPRSSSPSPTDRADPRASRPGRAAASNRAASPGTSSSQRTAAQPPPTDRRTGSSAPNVGQPLRRGRAASNRRPAATENGHAPPDLAGALPRRGRRRRALRTTARGRADHTRPASTKPGSTTSDPR